MLLNLEPKAATAATNMVKDIDANNDGNVITKSLLVLSEQGLTAFGLFLATRKSKDEAAANRIHDAITHLLLEIGITTGKEYTNSSTSTYYQELTQQRDEETSSSALQRILLTKDIIEKALIYGRYHAKAHVENLKKSDTKKKLEETVSTNSPPIEKAPPAKEKRVVRIHI
ncbi:MAG: hypothetical protein KAH77_07995 [Thiomargarita sp.]|nr:hypothetical protein [Thiomargarita sp.]